MRYAQQTRIILTTLLICITIASAVACQLHAESVAYEHGVPTGHHQSFHDGSAVCLTAVLPESPLLMAFASIWLAATIMLWYSSMFVLLPFTPPRFTTC